MSMYVKIWGVKPNKAGKTQGVSNVLDYITDDDKTAALDDENNELKIAENYQSDAMSTVLSYMKNSDKTTISEGGQDKWISGYLCNPDHALEEFLITREKNLERVGKDVDDDNGNLAFHIVQSFPRDINITPAEVHEAGIRLCEKIGLYQAVVCTHIHPVVDKETGELRGTQPHNHILMNAHTIDPVKQNGSIERMKYHDCKETYAELQLKNDEVALDMGLPIVDEHSLGSGKDWFEDDQVKKGTSWKEKIRIDIYNAKRVANNWDEYISIMEKAGYEIKQGKYVSYKHPEQERAVRDVRLGDMYTKAGIQQFWADRDRIHNDIIAEQNRQAIEAQDDDKRKQYYQHKNWKDTKTHKPYRMSLYNQEGLRRTLLEVIILTAVYVIKNESDRWSADPAFQSNEPQFKPGSWKVQQLAEALRTSRELGVSNMEEVEDKTKNAGMNCSRIRYQFKKLDTTLNKMEGLHDSVEKYLSVKDVCEEIYNIQDPVLKEQKEQEHSEELAIYKLAKADLYKHKCASDEEISDFLTRYNEVKKNRNALADKFDVAKRDYTKWKKLERSLQLAQNEQFCFGSEYRPEYERKTTDKDVVYQRPVKEVEKPTKPEKDVPATDSQKSAIKWRLTKDGFKGELKNEDTLTIKEADTIIRVLNQTVAFEGEDKAVYLRYIDDKQERAQEHEEARQDRMEKDKKDEKVK